MSGDGPKLPEPLGPGDGLGPYVIHRRLRSSRGTEVYQAGERRSLENLLVRLEVHLPDAEQAESFIMLWSEMTLFIHFQSPHVLRILHLGNEGRRFYVAMPWVSARSLLACIEDDRGRPWPVDAALSVARDVALGLGALHRWKVLGRPMNALYKGVSPETLLISGRGRALLRPPSLAEPVLALRHASLARIQHLSPEAARASPLTPASDVASLGSVLYRLLAGLHPYRAVSQREVLELTLAARFKPLRSIRSDLPVPVEHLIHRMMALDPSERPEDGTALAEALEAAASEAGITLGALAVRRARRAASQRAE